MSAIPPVASREAQRTPFQPTLPGFGASSGAPRPDRPRTLEPTPPTTPGLKRDTYDAGNKELPEGTLGKLIRNETSKPVGDDALDAAHDYAGVVYDFFQDVLGRDSLDDKGMPLMSVGHYGKDFNNAYWDGHHMTYGDGDGKMFVPLSKSLDVVAHEIAHGVTERTANLEYERQPGALNESWSDVFGELVEQWHTDKKLFATPEGAKKADWMIGEDIFTPGVNGDALRSLKAPGTAYSGDPQPAHMKQYVETPEDNGGVHINSGIPNKAAYEVATRIGGEKTAKIWYKALTEHLKPTSQFSEAARSTLQAAMELYKDGPEVQAVRDAWTAVGLTPTAKPKGEAVELVSPDRAKNPGIVPPWLQLQPQPQQGRLALA